MTDFSTWNDKEIRAEAERIAFAYGGWLEAACKMRVGRDYLKSRFTSGTMEERREWLARLKAELKLAQVAR